MVVWGSSAEGYASHLRISTPLYTLDISLSFWDYRCAAPTPARQMMFSKAVKT